MLFFQFKAILSRPKNHEKIQFLESKKRLELFKKFPPKYVYIHSERQLTSRDSSFKTYNAKSIAYIWIIWEKGFNGETVLRWI